jgi:hypothetical protein
MRLPFEMRCTKSKPSLIVKTTPQAALPPPPLTKGEFLHRSPPRRDSTAADELECLSLLIAVQKSQDLTPESFTPESVANALRRQARSDR